VDDARPDLLASPGRRDDRPGALAQRQARGDTRWPGHARSCAKSASAWKSTATSPARC